MSEEFLANNILNYLNSKLQNASHQNDFEIRLKVLKDIADYIHLDISSVSFTNASFINSDHMKIIDEQWKQILQKNFQVSQEDLDIYYQFKYNNLLTQKNIHKVIEFLANHNYIIRYGNEKILKSNTLVSLLAVDGFSGFSFCDLTYYVVNLKTEKYSFDNTMFAHLKAIRQVYELPFLKKLSGSDAAAIIFLSLLKIYKNYVKQDECISYYQNDVDNYLLKNSKTYPDIVKAKEKINNIIHFYKLNVNNIPIVANIKINQLQLRFKNK